MQPTNLIQSVARAVDILEALGRSEQGLGVTELARQLGLKVPTTHNLLRTLSVRRYVAKDRTGQRYRLGFACGQIGRAYAQALRVPDLARPVIDALADRFNESVVVAMMEQGEIFFVARAAGDQMLAVNFEGSWVKTGYTSVCGRVLLAYLPGPELDAYVDAHPIEPGQIEDLPDREALERSLEQTRRDGHLEYWRDNNAVLAIAAPIRDYTSAVVASVGVGIPGVRFKESEREATVGAVMKAARRLSAELGFSESSSPLSKGKGQ